MKGKIIILNAGKYHSERKKHKLAKFSKKATASCIAAAMCVTSLPAAPFAVKAAAATPAERDDNSIVYYVDCGDYVPSTPGEGEQFGTHNSVTDQAYGEDDQTGYKWGIVDGEELTGNGVTNAAAPDTGGVYTANTWAFEQNTAKEDIEKTKSNRYSKNFFEKGIADRFIKYDFELEAGTYEVTVGCSNPWNVSKSPVVKVIPGGSQESDGTIISDDGFSVPNKGFEEAEGTVEVAEGENKLSVDVHGTGDDNKCVNVAYILIRSVKAGETQDDKNVRKDLEALKLPENTKESLKLPSSGANGSTITWQSSNTNIISNDGNVTRPAAGESEATVILTATVKSGDALQTKEFTIKVPAEGGHTPIDREDNYVIYFVDCGDYVVNTVSDGDQFGTHNSVTDQAYGEDNQTGYKWGIVDGEELTGNNKSNPAAPDTGGVYTANTWAFEQNTAQKDTEKTKSNRYTKNFFEKGIAERYLDYKFELENDRYDVTVCCVDPWGVSQSPDVYLDYGKSSQMLMKKGLDAASGKPVKKTINVTDGELTVNVRATGDNNKAINLAYILIRKYKELTQEEKEAYARDMVTKDMALLNIASTNITDDIALLTEGENETTITWNSSDKTVLSDTGKVTRPAVGSADVPVKLEATVSYTINNYTYSDKKVFDLNVLAESDMENLQEFALKDVEITDDYYNTVAIKDVAFLNKFDPDRLLYNFRLAAGYKADEIKQFDVHNNGTGAEKPYPGGWENSLIGGHTMGHYLAAAAQAVANGYGNEKGEDGLTIKERIAYLVKELKNCQDKRGTGFIFGAKLEDVNNPEKQFDAVEGKGGGQWVPWYTMHKIVNGLIETYKLADDKETSETALEVVEALSEWIYKRTSQWNTTTQNKVLSIEYGGMNDCLYEVYKYAKQTGYENAEHIAEAAHKFDEDSLFEAVLAGTPNHLNNKHANCTIPKFMGALNRYRVLGSEKYLEYAKAFWTLVTEKHTYITGGNSECEHFGADNILDKERSHCNCETCNTYNMLKYTRELYRITGDKKYADYYENTFINAIMASVNAETGMTTYFQPMATGYFKVYCNPDLEKNYFWCCTGTGLENFTKLGDSFYYYTDDKLIVNQYTSSKVTWNDVLLEQETDIPNSDKAKFTVNLLNGIQSKNFSLRLRVPDWIMGETAVTVNGEIYNATASNGYISLDRVFTDGDIVEITLPMGIRAYTLPDNAGKVYGFKYGPVVLAAELGKDNEMRTYQVGVQCDVCQNKIVNGQQRTTNAGYGSTSNQGTLTSETLNMQDVSVSEFIGNIEEYLVKDGDSLSFTLQGTDWGGDEPLKFTPYYKITDQRYGIYWLFAADDPSAIAERILQSKREGRDNNTYLDGIGIGYGVQTEGDENNYPHLQNEGTGSVQNMGEQSRYANADGSFSYLFKVDTEKTNYLNCEYSKNDNGKTMVIKAGDIVIAEDILNYDGVGTFYKKKYKIPSEAIALAMEYAKKDDTTGETETRNVIRISFSGAAGKDSPKLWHSAYTSTNYDNNADITAITSDIGTVKNTSETEYRLEVPLDTKQVQLKTTLASQNGLLYIDGILTDDTKAKKINLENEETVIAISVFAENFGEEDEVKKDYKLTIVKTDGTQEPEPSAPATDSPEPSAPATNSPEPSAPATDSPEPSAPATGSPEPSAPATGSPEPSAPVTGSPEPSAPATQSPTKSPLAPYIPYLPFLPGGTNDSDTSASTLPAGTNAPGASTAPAGTNAPGTSTAPADTQEPAASTAPAGTNTPGTSQTPVVTQTPDTVTEIKKDDVTGTITEITTTINDNVSTVVEKETLADGTQNIKETVTETSNGIITIKETLNSSASNINFIKNITKYIDGDIISINAVLYTGSSENTSRYSAKNTIPESFFNDAKEAGISNITLYVEENIVNDVKSNQGKRMVVKVEVPSVNGISLGKVILTKEAASAASGSNRKFVVKMENKNARDSYTITIPPSELKKIKSDTNITVSSSKVSGINGSKQKKIENILSANGIKAGNAAVVSIASNNTDAGIKASAPVITPAIKAGSKVYVYCYNKKTGKLEETANSKRKVLKNGMTGIEGYSGNDYIVTNKELTGKNVVTLLGQSKVSISKTSVKKGSKTKINITLPAGLTARTSLKKDVPYAKQAAVVKCKSSDTKVAKVSKDGTIKATGKGNVKITVQIKLADGKVKTVKKKVTIK